MKTVDSILDLIGRTPLLRLKRLEDPDGGEIWAKLESLNPGFSVKDRIGLALIRGAEADGRLKEGGTVVEATAGNTGLALAMVGRQLGYNVVLVMPEHFSIEKRRLIQALGGEVVVTPSHDGMAGALRRAQEITDTTPGAAYVNQFDNQANPNAHFETTGPEIYEQMGGRLDALVAGCGSGGTFSGAARFLKQEIPHLLAVAVEPKGSILAGGESGEYEVYVRSFPEPGARFQVSSGGGEEPVWAPDGQTLYFRRGDELVAASVTVDPEFRVLGREPILDDLGSMPVQAFAASYDVHPDGDRFIFFLGQEEEGVEVDRTLYVVTNWFTELRERMGEGN
jgi:cysteine synthase